MEHISKYLTVKNTELQTQEYRELRTSDEQVFDLAIKEPRVAIVDRKDLVALLRFLMLKVGLRVANLPAQEEFDVLVAHIYENFPGHTLPEIRLAFEMAMGDKLGLKDGANCFENFSCMYFSSIMNAYRKWAKGVPPPKEELKKPKIYSDDELDDLKREDAERQYQLFLRGYELRGIEINKTILEKDKLLTFFPEEYKNGFRIDGCYESVIDFFKRKREAGFRNIYRKEKE